MYVCTFVCRCINLRIYLYVNHIKKISYILDCMQIQMFDFNDVILFFSLIKHIKNSSKNSNNRTSISSKISDNNNNSSNKSK